MQELTEALNELRRSARRVGHIDRGDLKALTSDVERLRLAIVSLDQAWVEFCEHVEGYEGAPARELLSSLELILAKHRDQSAH